MNYRHVQWGYLLPPVALMFIVISIPSLSAEGNPPWLPPVLVLFEVGILVIVGLFSRLEVTVDERGVIAGFGFGRPHRVVPFEDVVGVSTTRNKWWYGFGVRLVGNGTMYNVWGLDAVEMELRSGKVFRIGSDDAETLYAAIALRGPFQP